MKYIILTLFSIFMMFNLSAQNRIVKGTVHESGTDLPVVGATVMLKNQSAGTITDIDGNYSININNNSDVLLFSYIGYETKEETAGARSVINVSLKESSQLIDEVVVTALGLSREEKSLGYAISKVDGDDLTKSVSSNWISNLNGKVPGLSMTSAGTGPGGTVRVILRGDNSLNYGANEALFVIDGVPVMSNTVGSGSGANYANSNAPVDFGNAVSDINPDDIESVSVLKGAAAAALYGSNAQNGVIMITTRKARKEKGLGITYNGSVTFEQAGYFPDFQKEYGPSAVGTSLTNKIASAWGLPGYMTEDGIAVRKQISRYAYGEAFDASKMRYLYMSKNWETGEFSKMPWVYADDWYTGIFETGVVYTNSVSVDGSNGKGTSARFSLTDSRNYWILPNSGYNQQTFALSLNQEVNKYINFAAKVNYVRRDSDNMPIAGYSAASPMYGLIWGYTTNPMSAYRDEYMKGRYTRANYEAGNSEDAQNITSSLIFNSLEGHNPYRTLYEELNKLDRDRVFGNINVDIQFLPQLKLAIRSGMDMNIEWRSQQKPKMTLGNPEGMYREKTVRQYEYNSDFMLMYTDGFANNRFQLSMAFGGSNWRNKYYSTTIEASQLVVESGSGMYSFANSAVPLDVSAYRSNRAKVSLYGFTNMSWDDTYFLDVTARNDWSSTLHPKNWSYFYPSVCASILLDKMFNINSRSINMIKVRGSWASVGNDTSVFSLYPDYTTSAYPGGFYLPSTIPDPMIMPERTNSYEIGLDVKLFQNRLSFDVAYYKTVTENQIISATQSAEIGATSMKINAGRIDNKGIELSFRVTPVRTRNFNWDIYGNWSLNKNKLISLQDDWDPETPLQSSTSTTIGSRVFIYSYVGQAMQQLYGKDYVRAPKGAYYTDDKGNKISCEGMPLINEKTGYPSFTEADQHLGQVNPDWKAGFGTLLRYKGLSLSAQFTAQVGGNAYSVTNFALSYQGKLKNSLPGRDGGLIAEGVNAVTNEDGTISYKANNTITENVYTYYQTYQWNRDNGKSNTFSTDFLKLKEVRLDYQLPAKALNKIKVLQSANIGVFATNLFCITDWPQYDPEAAALVNGTNIYAGIETVTFPMTRTYGLNLKLQF